MIANLGTTSLPKSITPMLAWSVSTDGQTLTLILDTVHSATLGSSDSAWLSSLIQDRSGNRPGLQTRRVPLKLGLRPLQLKIGTYPPLLKNEGATAWTVPPAGTPQFEILVRPQGSGLPWQVLKDGVLQPVPANDTNHLTGMLLTLNRPLSGTLYVYDNIGVSVGKISLKDLTAAWDASNSGSKDQVNQVWIGWNGTNANNSFVASGVYLLRLVALVELEPGKTQLHNMVKKVGWKRN